MHMQEHILLSHTRIHYEHGLIHTHTHRLAHSLKLRIWGCALEPDHKVTLDHRFSSALPQSGLILSAVQRAAALLHVFLSTYSRIHVAHFCFLFHGLKGFPASSVLGHGCTASLDHCRESFGRSSTASYKSQAWETNKKKEKKHYQRRHCRCKPAIWDI